MMFGEEYRVGRLRIENPCSWVNHPSRLNWDLSSIAVHSPTRMREHSPFYVCLWYAPADITIPKRHVTRLQQVGVEELSARVQRLGQRILNMESVIDESICSIDASFERIRATQAEIERIKQGLQVD